MNDMVIVRFPNEKAERSALSCLPGRFPFKTWSTGELMVSASALAYLALKGIAFQVDGPASYERFVPLPAMT